MRKIGIVSEYFYPHLGGITEHVYHYAAELIRRGFDVTLLTGYKGETLDVPLPPTLKIIRIGKSVPFFSNNSFAKLTIGWNLGTKVKRILEKEQFDLLHIHAVTTPVLPLVFEQHSKMVTIGTLHTYFDSAIFYKLFQKMCQRFLDHLDGLIAVAPSCIKAMGRYFNFKHGYRIIPNGVDVAWFAHPSGKLAKYQDRAPTVLFLGRLDPRNGLDTLLAAFPLVLKKIAHARLIVLGDGPLRSLYENQAGPLLEHSIFFEGQIHELRPDYFAACDVFCYPATKASFGITLLEAMAAGKPVIAADNCGFRDIITSGENGLLAERDHPQALADAVVNLLQNSALAQSLAAKGRDKVQRYAWSSVTDEILAYYDEIYRQKKGVPFV